MKPIYLDYAATTPVDPRVKAAMMDCLDADGLFGNPASRSHLYGWLAEEAAEDARRQVADALQADPREIVWTSGATEADNLALKGAALARRERGRHIISSAAEHKAVLDPLYWLGEQGFDITLLNPGADGIISPQQVADALRDDTILVSLMHANNETGVLTDIAAIGALCRAREVLFHVDAAQTFGKEPLSMATLPVDLLSVCAHKLYGPKGVGALYVRRAPGLVLDAQIHGGGHERGLRSGTLPTHQLVGFGTAAALAMAERESEQARLQALRARLWAGLEATGVVRLNGHPTQRVAGILNVAFPGRDGELLMTAFAGIAISSGSACTSASLDPSHVLTAMGLNAADALSSLRFSLGRFTSEADVDVAIGVVSEALTRLSA